MIYTEAMRERDVKILAMLLTFDRERLLCGCTGACLKASPAYKGACVAVPHFHNIALMQQEIMDLRAEAYTLKQQPRGCICPPTSEKTCKGPMCPRQGHSL